MVVSLITLKVALTLLANFTPVTLPPFVKLTPVIVTVLPGLPATGLILVIAGQLSPGARAKLASEISKKILPTAATLMRAVELRIPLGSITDCDPSLGVLAARVIGKVNPPSVERVIVTFAQLTGARLVLLTFQVTVWAPLNVPPPLGAVIANGPEFPSTVIATELSLTPPKPLRLSRTVARKFIVRETAGRFSAVWNPPTVGGGTFALFKM